VPGASSERSNSPGIGTPIHGSATSSASTAAAISSVRPLMSARCRRCRPAARAARPPSSATTREVADAGCGIEVEELLKYADQHRGDGRAADRNPAPPMT